MIHQCWLVKNGFPIIHYIGWYNPVINQLGFWTLRNWKFLFLYVGKSRTKASFSQLQLSVLEGCLARKLRFHNFNFQILKKVSHYIFVYTTLTFSFWGKSRTKASFSQLQLSVLEGCLARKLRFHNFNFKILKKVSHYIFVYTTLTFSFWGKSRTKASFHLLVFREVSRELAQRLWQWVFCCFFLVFGAFHFPLKMSFKMASKSWFWRRFWARDEMSWEEPRRAEKTWEELRRAG